MNKFSDYLHLFLARGWHICNYPRYKLLQKQLAAQVRGYLESLASAGTHSFPLPLNTLTRQSFNADPEWNEVYKSLGYGEKELVHRKMWEYTHVLYGLKKLGMLREDAAALGVASGFEKPLYYLANQCGSVVGTDLFEGTFALKGSQETSMGVFTSPEKFAPFPYRKEHLTFRQMNALDLKFPDNSFDIIFCISSIEHFGGPENYKRAAREMARVLKPGGVAAIVTEFALNNVDYNGFFTARTLFDYIITPSGLELVEPFDFTLDPGTLDTIQLMPLESNKTPHIVLQQGRERIFPGR